MLDFEQCAAAKRRDYLGHDWFSWLVQRFVDLLLFRKVVSQLWIPLRNKGRYVTVTQYKSLGTRSGEEAERWTVIKIGPLYCVPDHGSHDAIVYAAVNTAIEQEKSVEEFDMQRLLDEGVSCGEALQAVSQAGEPAAQTYYNLGEICVKMGNKDLALEKYEILETLDEELADELLGLTQE